jgi:hypothetical protein
MNARLPSSALASTTNRKAHLSGSCKIIGMFSNGSLRTYRESRENWLSTNLKCILCGRTSQVIGPTCTYPCPKDLKRLCMCTKQLNRICPTVPRTPDKPLTTKIAGLSKHNSHTNTCSGNKFSITKRLQVYQDFIIHHRSDYKTK